MTINTQLTKTEVLPTANLTVREQVMLTDFLKHLQQAYGSELVAVIFFGSKARGQSNEESDVDLAIILTEVNADMQQEIRYLATDAWLEYGTYLSTRIWSLVHWEQLQAVQTALYQNIRQDGILLLNKDNLIDIGQDSQLTKKKTVEDLFGKWQGQVVYYEDINKPTIEQI